MKLNCHGVLRVGCYQGLLQCAGSSPILGLEKGGTRPGTCTELIGQDLVIELNETGDIFIVNHAAQEREWFSLEYY
jgi:hypothetical protein